MTTNKPMTGEQLDELMAVAVRMQRDAEVARDFPSANFAYAVQVAVLELCKVRADVVALAAENAALKSAVQTHSESIHFCELCGKDDPCSTDDVCMVLSETPSTDAFMAEVRASALEGLAKKKRDEKMSLHPDTFALGSVIAALDMQVNELEDLAAQLRQDANTAELVAAGIITKVGE